MYPISLRLYGKPCCVIGGGKVAERKVEGLLAAGAEIRVISPQLTARLRELHADRRIAVELRAYRAGDLAQAALVFAATDDEDVNRAVCREAESRGLWVNDAMSPERSTFHVPAVLRRGSLQIGVSTSGAGPMLASRIRDELAEAYGDVYETYLDLLGDLRLHLQRIGMPEREKRMLYKRWIEDKDRILRELDQDRSAERLGELRARLLADARSD